MESSSIRKNLDRSSGSLFECVSETCRFEYVSLAFPFALSDCRLSKPVVKLGRLLFTYGIVEKVEGRNLLRLHHFVKAFSMPRCDWFH